MSVFVRELRNCLDNGDAGSPEIAAEGASTDGKADVVD
jgi:hypothetical protein